MKLKSLLYFLMISPALVSLAACSDDDDDATEPNPSNVTTEVLNSFKAKYPTVDVRKDVEWEIKGKYTVAEFPMLSGNEELEVWFETTTGDWKMTETDYGEDLFLISAPLNQAFYNSEYRSWNPTEIKSYEYPDSSRDVYIFECEKAGQPDTDVYFTPDAQYVKAVVHTGAEVTPDTVL